MQSGAGVSGPFPPLGTTYDAQVHIVGSVIGADPVISVNNLAATVVIRYDPAVLGTPGLRVPADAPVVAWVAGWEERP